MGSLNQTVIDAGRRLRREFTPMDLVHRGQQVTIPISGEEAQDLFDGLNAHFHSWTGKSLATWLRETT